VAASPHCELLPSPRGRSKAGCSESDRAIPRDCRDDHHGIGLIPLTSTLAAAGRLRLLMLTAALTVGSARAGAAQTFTGDPVFDSRDAGLELGSVSLSGLAVSTSGRLAIVDSHSASLWL